MKKFKIFLSHSSHDREKAQRVHDALCEFGELDCFVSWEIVGGDNWRERLDERLRSSELFLLLFTGSRRNVDWSWCAWEAGKFESADNRSEPMVALHRVDDERPRQLSHLQSCPATPEDVRRFLIELLTGTELTQRNEPLRERARLTDEQLDRVTERICAELADIESAHYLCHRIELEIPPDVDLGSGIPRASLVTARRPSTLELFNVHGATKCSYGDLIRHHIETSNAKWVEALDDHFARLASINVEAGIAPSATDELPPAWDFGRVRRTATGSFTFPAHPGGVLYRTQVYRVNRLTGRPSSVSVLLLPVDAPKRVGGPIFQMIRINERYRAEVFEEHIRHLRRAEGEDVLVALREIHDAISLIRSESRLLDVFDPTIFGAVFADVRGREALEELLDRRTDLLQSVIDETLIRPTDPTRPDDGDERADDVADALPRVKTVLMLLSELEQLTNEMWIGFADVYADRVRRLSHHAEDGELVPAAELVPAEETS